MSYQGNLVPARLRNLRPQRLVPPWLVGTTVLSGHYTRWKPLCKIMARKLQYH